MWVLEKADRTRNPKTVRIGMDEKVGKCLAVSQRARKRLGKGSPQAGARLTENSGPRLRIPPLAHQTFERQPNFSCQITCVPQGRVLQT